MISIQYSASSFTGSLATVNGTKSLSVTWAQLVWAAITSGKAAGDEYAFGAYSALERLHRASMLRAYLYEGATGLLQQTKPYLMSDPSEKTSISYYIGTMMAKLLAAELLDAPRLLHYAVYQDAYKVDAGSGKSRPDLIGLTISRDWVVMEAKGRSGSFDQQALNAAKGQAQQITSIDGKLPICRVASEAYFGAGGLQVEFNDPPGPRHAGRQLKVSANKFFQLYYGPLRSIVESRGAVTVQRNRRKYREAPVADADMWLAVPQSDEQSQGSKGISPDDQEYLGPDDVFVRLGASWSTANMKLEPHLRA